MRFIADENIPSLLVRGLQAAGHDVLWVKAASPGVPDFKVLAMAVSDGRILITQDKAFASNVSRLRDGQLPGLILLRLDALRRPALVARALSAILSGDDWQNRYAVISETSIRIKPLNQ